MTNAHVAGLMPRMSAVLLRQLLDRYHMAKAYLDFPTIGLTLRFRELRRQYYAELWRSSASAIGASIAPWRYGYFRISRDDMTTIVHRSRVMLDNHLTLNMMGNKVLTYDLLAELGCKTPRFASYNLSTLAKAKEFFEDLDGPVVVKPAAQSSAGRGVTTGIASAKALKEASKYAARYCADLIVEEQLSGTSYRLLYLGGEFLDAVRFTSPTLMGDGRTTIRDLIKQENRSRLERRPITSVNPLTVDLDCRYKLAEQKFSLSSRPAHGVEFVVKQTSNQSRSNEKRSVKDELHPELILAGSRVAKLLGVRLAGLDIISPDVSGSVAAQGSYFSEVNTTPGLHHHYLISNPEKVVPVAQRVLEHIFTTGEGTMRL